MSNKCFVYGEMIVETGYIFIASEGISPKEKIRSDESRAIENPESLMEWRNPMEPPFVILVPAAEDGKISVESAAKLMDAHFSQINSILEKVDGPTASDFISQIEPSLLNMGRIVEGLWND